MNDFTTTIRAKGWLSKELAARWGITPRAMSRIAANPKQVHWDALKGLPPVIADKVATALSELQDAIANRGIK